MSVTITTRNLATFAASATAVAAAGLLSMPVAHAASCTVNGDYLRFQQHEGPYTTTTSVNAKGSALGPGVVSVPPSGTNGTYGKASGSINGRDINVHIIWDDNKGTADFTGTIGDDGIARGNSTGTPIPINLWTPGPWDTAPGQLSCTDDQNGAAKTATVLQATNVFNQPDGRGTEYRNANGNTISAPPGKVQLVEPDLCRDNWCHIVPPAGVNGEAWIYIGEGFGTYP